MNQTEILSEISRAKAIVNKCAKQLEHERHAKSLANIVIDMNTILNDLWEK